MTAVSSTSAAFVAALKTQLETRFSTHPTLDTVRVFAVPPASDVPLADTVILIRAPVEELLEYLHPAYMRNVEATVPGWVHAQATDPDLDVAWQSAMDRAALILDEVIQEVRDNHPIVGAQTFSALVTTVNSHPYIGPDGGWICRISFDIFYKARVD